jgi:hypothetical protein
MLGTKSEDNVKATVHGYRSQAGEIMPSSFESGSSSTSLKIPKQLELRDLEGGHLEDWIAPSFHACDNHR